MVACDDHHGGAHQSPSAGGLPCSALQVFDPTQTRPQHLNVLLIGFNWAELLLRYESSTPTSKS